MDQGPGCRKLGQSEQDIDQESWNGNGLRTREGTIHGLELVLDQFPRCLPQSP